MTVHVIGLTGGIASGKSTVARMLAERGAAIVDADQLARQVVEPGEPALAELVARFGTQILAPDGTLDRKRLGAIAFSDPKARADLGRITHPRIAAASAAAIATWADAGANVVFYEAALLVENKAHSGLAALVVVSASPEVQVARVMARDGLGEDDARARIAAQLPLADKVAAATWVIDNDGDQAALAAEVDRVVAAIEERFGAVAVPARRVRKNAATGKVMLAKSEIALVTGFSKFMARHVISRLLAPLAPPGGDAPPPPEKIFVLARERVAAEAHAFAEVTPLGDRLEILIGDSSAMDLGLSSAEYRTLAKAVTWIHHVAPTPPDSVLDLARDAAGLERLVMWSYVLADTDRRGIIMEADMFDAEHRVRTAMRQLPITILRPGVIVGHSVTGETDNPDDLITLLVRHGGNARLPLFAGPDAHLPIVPIDYVVDAAWYAMRSEGAAGKVFHLVDPEPLDARDAVERVAELAGSAPPRGLVPRLFAREVVPATLATFDDSNTTAALAGTGLRCPSPAEYLPRLVAFATDTARAPEPRPSQRNLNETLDPLD